MAKGQSEADKIKESELRGGKVAKTDPLANYMGPDKGPFLCNMCEYFKEPRSCEKVKGDIDPAGCCNLFQPDKDEEE